MNYAEWNNQITKKFFSQDYDGRRVFLSVTKDMLEELGGANGVRDFIDAVKQGPAEIPRTSLGLCARILDATKWWRQQGALDSLNLQTDCRQIKFQAAILSAI